MNKDLVGQTLLNQFRVDAFVASGGMATVYQVWDLKRNVSLAMKVLNADLADEPAILRRFQREAKALKQLTHPHIVPFYGLYQTSDVIFLLERFVDGISLKDRIRKQRGSPIGIQETLIYLKALCASLGYAHANGMVHCDVKPGNVMIDISGSIYLTDFGITRYSESTTTSLGTVGTSAYMAPEQIRGETVSGATDVYALGVMSFELLTGQRPFRGSETIAQGHGETVNERIRYCHLHVQPPDPRSVNPALSETVAEVVLRALNKKPEERYQDVQDFFREFCLATGVDIAEVQDRVLLNLDTIEQIQGTGKVALATTTQQPSSSPKNVVSFGRSSRAYMLIGIGIVSLVLTMSLLYEGLNSPTAVVSATAHQTREIQATATRTPRPTPTRRPSATPAPTEETEFVPVPWNQYDCPDKDRIKLRINDAGRAVVDRVELLEKPAASTSPDYQVIRFIQVKERILVLNGPQCVNGSTWWEVKTESSNIGWSQEYDSVKGTLLLRFNR